MLAPLLALAMQISDASKGSALYSECKAYISYIDKTGPSSNDFEGALCIGYISGFSDSANGDHFCASEATMGTIVRVYIAYMDKNPKLFDAPKAVGLDSAMREAYPCPIKK
jgi:hypothetical protein